MTCSSSHVSFFFIVGLLLQQSFGEQCSELDFPQDLTDYQCYGFDPAPGDRMGHPIDTEQACVEACCSDPQCSAWQFSSNPVFPADCWLFSKAGVPGCVPQKGWKGGGGRKPPTTPPPTPAPAGPLEITLLARGVNATKLPFTSPPEWSVDPTGHWLGADSLSLLRKTPGSEVVERWYPIGGEIHFSRLPQSQWREELLRMRSGGLDLISVYAFWIHHEEVRGKFDFSGRRNISEFLQIAQSLGLKVLLRIGPWDHGEVRNGGHPDWVVQPPWVCGPARTVDPGYLACTKALYEALAPQLRGLYHKDGGPIIMVQVDNEAWDWKYLLALKDLAIKAGITPFMFAKTGWPTPSPDYPKDYPMLPFFGGYPDQMWVNEMKPAANYDHYL